MERNRAHNSHWLDDHGHIHGTCRCGHDCSTHPDAANPLAGCGDCGADTCPDCRVEDQATRCVECASVFYAQPPAPVADGQLVAFFGALGLDVTVWACKSCGRCGNEERCACTGTRGQIATREALQLYMNAYEPPTGWYDDDELRRVWAADASTSYFNLSPKQQERLAAYEQGRRDREQGWPDFSYYWKFTGDALIAYRHGYDNPRTDARPVNPSPKAK